MSNAEKWMNTPTLRIRAFAAATGDTIAVGRVIAYHPHPTVLIEAEDGTHTWWAEHLCEVAETPIQAAARRLREHGWDREDVLGRTYAGFPDDYRSVTAHVLRGGTL